MTILKHLRLRHLQQKGMTQFLDWTNYGRAAMAMEERDPVTGRTIRSRRPIRRRRQPPQAQGENANTDRKEPDRPLKIARVIGAPF